MGCLPDRTREGHRSVRLCRRRWRLHGCGRAAEPPEFGGEQERPPGSNSGSALCCSSGRRAASPLPNAGRAFHETCTRILTELQRPGRSRRAKARAGRYRARRVADLVRPSVRRAGAVVLFRAVSGGAVAPVVRGPLRRSGRRSWSSNMQMRFKNISQHMDFRRHLPRDRP